MYTGFVNYLSVKAHLKCSFFSGTRFCTQKLLFSSRNNFLPVFYTNSPTGAQVLSVFDTKCPGEGSELSRLASGIFSFNCQHQLLWRHPKSKDSGRKQNAASRLCAQGSRFWKCSAFCDWICESWGFLWKEINKALRSIMNAGASMKGAGVQWFIYFFKEQQKWEEYSSSFRISGF